MDSASPQMKRRKVRGKERKVSKLAQEWTKAKVSRTSQMSSSTRSSSDQKRRPQSNNPKLERRKKKYRWTCSTTSTDERRMSPAAMRMQMSRAKAKQRAMSARSVTSKPSLAMNKKVRYVPMSKWKRSSLDISLRTKKGSRKRQRTLIYRRTRNLMR